MNFMTTALSGALATLVAAAVSTGLGLVSNLVPDTFV